MVIVQGVMAEGRFDFLRSKKPLPSLSPQERLIHLLTAQLAAEQEALAAQSDPNDPRNHVAGYLRTHHLGVSATKGQIEEAISQAFGKNDFDSLKDLTAKERRTAQKLAAKASKQTQPLAERPTRNGVRPIGYRRHLR